MKDKALYVHFDGMDLAGKSTATKNFITKTGRPWEIRQNSIVPNNPIYFLADSLRRADAYDAEVLGNLYVAALMVDLRSFTWPMIDTIQDSTIFLRSLAFHSIRNTPRVAEVILGMKDQHPKFDVSFIFTASLEKRKVRLEQRMRNEPKHISPEDMMVIEKPEKFMAMEQFLVDFAKLAFNSVVIDTTNLTPELVIAQIMQNMPQLTSNGHK